MKLLRIAEEIARFEFNCNKIYVLSGVGVREYYRKQGYRKLNELPYMVKELKNMTYNKFEYFNMISVNFK